jgi:hypothetical protein
MCENMAICVKYAQKLKCVQFLKPCVQFLIDTILNLTIVQFLGKKKEDVLLLHVFLILRKGRHACSMHISFLMKKETHDMRTRLPFT